jgi:hypothetical protein
MTKLTLVAIMLTRLKKIKKNLRLNFKLLSHIKGNSRYVCDFIKFKISETVIIATDVQKLGTYVTALKRRRSGLQTRLAHK